MTVALDQPMAVAPDGLAEARGAWRRSVRAAVASAASVAAIGLVVMAGRWMRSQAS
jgi:hypothetical protein